MAKLTFQDLVDFVDGNRGAIAPDTAVTHTAYTSDRGCETMESISFSQKAEVLDYVHDDDPPASYEPVVVLR